MLQSSDASEFIPRSMCLRCARPSRVCICPELRRLSTQTRVLIWQHPRERDVAINTARLVELALEKAELHVGLKLAQMPSLRRELSSAAAPPILLYPGEGARDLALEPPRGPVTLCVLDGTWWQARKLFRHNPELAKLPRYALSPVLPSRYRIRREPALHCISTIEAIAEALALLEPGGFEREALLRPFDAMVEHQLHFAQALASHRHLQRRQAPKKPKLPLLLRERAADLVIAYGEANAWPKGSALGGEPELVHWVAERLTSGERFQALIAPRRPLSPSFSLHTGVSAEQVLAGESFTEFARRWREFVRPRDLLLSWGFFASERLAAEGAALPERLDLRALARRQLRQGPGEAAACALALGGTLAQPWALGRGGERLAAAAAVARALLDRAGA